MQRSMNGSRDDPGELPGVADGGAAEVDASRASRADAARTLTGIVHRMLPLAVVAVVAVATFGLPVLLGLSWLPHPPSLSGPVERPPMTESAADLWTFPHVEWPWRRLEAAALAAGRIPWWNPYLSLGAPLAGQLESQVFHPIELIEIFLGPLGWNVMLVLKVAAAGLGTYLLARRLGLDLAGGLVAAVGYELSAYFIWFNALPSFVNEAFGVPWAFLGATLARDPRVDWRVGVGTLGVGVGGLLLAGQPQIAALALMGIAIAEAAALAGVLLATRSIRKVLRPAARLIAGALLGLGVAAIQILLMRDVVSHAFTMHTEGAFAGARTPPANFVHLLAPYVFGQLNAVWDMKYFPSRVNWEAFPLTAGGAQLMLLMLGLGRLVASRGRGVPLAGAVAPYALVLGVYFGIVAAESAGLTGLWGWGPTGRINFPRYSTPVTALMIAVLAGWAATELGALHWRELVVANGGGCPAGSWRRVGRPAALPGVVAGPR
jgi:hypothetical protein